MNFKGYANKCFFPSRFQKSNEQWFKKKACPNDGRREENLFTFFENCDTHLLINEIRKKGTIPLKIPSRVTIYSEGSEMALEIKRRRIEISACSLVKDDKKQKQEGIHSWIEDKDTWYKFSKTNERKKT